MTVTDQVAAQRAADRYARPRNFELAPIAGVLAREWALYRRTWAPITFSAVVEPILYLLAFGLGMGALVGSISGYSYIEFLGTGIVALAVLFSSMFPGLINTFVRRKFQHSYEGLLAAPVNVSELVTAEALWLGLKAGVYGCAPLLVALGFGLQPTWPMLFVPLIGALTGFGFALLGILLSAVIPSIRMVDYIISGIITPLFLVAGTFFPVDQLPSWAQSAALVNPLYHCVELVRGVAFGIDLMAVLGHVAVIVLFTAVVWGLAVLMMRRRLID